MQLSMEKEVSSSKSLIDHGNVNLREAWRKISALEHKPMKSRTLTVQNLVYFNKDFIMLRLVYVNAGNSW